MEPEAINQDDRFPSIPGYRIINLIDEGRRTWVYRGVRIADGQPVVLKLLKADCPSIQDLLRLQNYYTIAKNLNLPGIVQPLSLTPYGNSLLLVMLDEGVIPLSDYVVAHSPNLAEILEIALQLTVILHDLHKNRVIHKDIKPANFLIHPESKQVKLADFSLASLLPQEIQEIQNPNGLEGTLAYLSPEQTGRMNRGVDYRTDFYALGVTLFELLIGQLPFQSPDPLELVHCHIAQPVPKLDDLNLNLRFNIPAAVAGITAKLMAKNAEDRYQSALGLKYDLECCLSQLQETGTIEIFELGTRDLCDRFLIAEKLYGRNNEVQLLLQAFDRVAQGSSELMLVAGFSGIGKTAVVNEVHKPMTAQHGYFIKGKFDQLNCNSPLSAFVQALRDLMAQLLSESTVQLAQWRTKILAAVADNGQVLIDVIPELEYVIGKQSPPPELSGASAQNRFNWLFQKFIQVFTTSEHPLVMFLDDLQWADSASLQLIKVLMEDKQPYLLLLGAYRDNEVSAAHPFQVAIEDLKQTGKTIHTLTLSPLNFWDTNQWIADTLHCSTERSHPLTELVVRKTKGNPFFITQFLKALHQEGQILFNDDQGYWECDIAQINALSLTDDVVEFMAQQLQKLSDATQQILKLAACIGNQFDLETLAIVTEQSETATAADLWQALQAGLILPQSEVYKFYLSRPETEANPIGLEATLYRFLHDRVQQAAYSLIPNAQKQVMHYKIGQRLLNGTSERDREERIFEIVNQNNVAIDLIEQPAERAVLAKLNLMAGQKAKNSTAYRAAAEYFAIGRSLLGGDRWQRHYDLTLALSAEAAEMAYLNAELDEMDALIEEVVHEAKTALDLTRVYIVRINACTSQGQFLESIQVGVAALRQFEIDLPESPSPADVDRVRQTTQTLLDGRNPAALLDLPEMTNPRILAVLQILEALAVPAYLAKPQLNALITMIQMNLSMTYGNAPGSALAYASYGLFLCGVAGDIEQGYEFGQLALNLLAKLKEKRLLARVMFVTAVFIFHWKVHLRESLSLLQNAYAVGWESGSFMDLGYAAMGFSCDAFWLGHPLPLLEEKIAAYSKTLAQINQQTQRNYNELYHQAVLNLLGQTQNRCLFLDDAGKEQALLSQYQQANDRTGLWHFFFIKVMLCYLFHDFESAVQSIEQAEYYSSGGKGMFNVPAFYFYAALTWLAIWPKQSKDEQERLLQQVTAKQNQMQEWATHAPMNHLHKFQLVEAEKCRILGDRTNAIELYDRAIVGAKENGFIQDEALANELAAQFYLDWGKEKVAASYMQEAYDCYTRWEAKAKVEDLEQHYPKLLSLVSNSASISSKDSIAPSHPPSHPTQSWDLETIIKASQTLSREIQLEQLLRSLIQLVVVNAGADKAMLYLESEGSLKLAIEYFDNAVQSLDSKAVDDCNQVPHALIHYVQNTLETVITDSKTHPSTIGDSYCLQYQPQSLLCTPILHQGKLVAILYLENAITASAFTDERVELLKVFCAQAAISLENARLYQQSQSYAQQLEISLSQLQESETRFHLLAANIPGVIYQLRLAADGTRAVLYINSGCYDLYEVTAEEFMAGRYGLRDFEHPEDYPIVSQAIAQSTQTLTPFNLEFRIVTQSGIVKWIQAAAQPRRYPDGSILWDGLVIDISDRKAAEAQLQAQAQQLSEYSETLEQRVEERTQALSQALTDLQTTQSELIQVEKMAALGQLTASIAHEINTPLGVIRSATSNIAAALSTSLQQLPVLLKSFSPQQQTDFLALVHDALTHQTPLSTQEERQLRRKLQHQLMAEGIAQTEQIATQLMLLQLDLQGQDYQAILKDPNCLEILQAAYSLVLQQQSVSNIQQEVDRAAKIVFALKTYSHQDNRGQKVLAKITDGLEVVLTLYQNRLKQGIQVVRRYDPVPEILCDPDVLTQVWVNLVDNAIYAMGQEGILEVAVTQQNDQIVVTMRDSGCGIPSEIQTQIFQPFFTTKPRGEGSGLGLDIVMQILQKQGGTIQLDSRPGNTLFTVKLPISGSEFSKLPNSPNSEIDHE